MTSIVDIILQLGGLFHPYNEDEIRTWRESQSESRREIMGRKTFTRMQNDGKPRKESRVKLQRIVMRFGDYIYHISLEVNIFQL